MDGFQCLQIIVNSQLPLSKDICAIFMARYSMSFNATPQLAYV